MSPTPTNQPSNQNLLALPNLSGHTVFECEPWKLTAPKNKFKTKKDMLSWAQNPQTDHCFYSGFEGVNPNNRVSSSNDVWVLRALCVDYDCGLLSSEEINGALGRPKESYRKPSYISRSYSGGVHAVFLFETPTVVYNKNVAKNLVKELKKFLKLNNLFPGLDNNFLEDTTTYLELGSDWRPVETATPLPKGMLMTCLLKAIEKTKFRGAGLVKIPFDVLEKEVHARWPGRWPGRFEEGARGPRFWEPDADAESVIVKDTGVLAYTGDQKFLSWRQLFGDHFVEEYESNRVLQSLEDIYWDGRDYWMFNELYDVWISLRKDDLALHLKTECGLSSTSVGGHASEVDMALKRVQNLGYVDIVVPMVGKPQGLSIMNGERMLNIAKHRALQPAEPDDYDEEDFPWIANFLDTLFDPDEQLNYFLAWLKRFYEGCYQQNLRRGHTIFLAGDVNQGKTLLSNVILSLMVGGHSDASSYLMGETSFNKDLFFKPLWVIDDHTPAADVRRQAIYSSIIKKITANQTFSYHPKFQNPVMSEWLGRAVITCNTDPESIRLLPHLDVSIAEKISLFKIRTATSAERGFTGDHVDKIRAELPYFCRWLLDWEYPEEVLGDPRYGVKNYMHKELYEIASDSSDTTQFEELLDMFLAEYFQFHPGEDANGWKGNASQLFTAMSNSLTTQSAMRDYSPRKLGRELQKLSARGKSNVIYQRYNNFRQWTITRMSGSEDEIDAGTNDYRLSE